MRAANTRFLGWSTSARSRTSTVAGGSPGPSTTRSRARPASTPSSFVPGQPVAHPDRVRPGAARAHRRRRGEGGALLVRGDLRRGRRPPTGVHDLPARGCPSTSTGRSQQSIFIPAGCAHGFQSLSEPADTFYRINRLHDPSEDLTIAYDDAELAIPWPLPVTDMSENDRRAAPLAELTDRLGDIRPSR